MPPSWLPPNLHPACRSPRVYSLYLDVDSGQAVTLFTNLLDLSPASSIVWVGADDFTLRVYLCRRNTGGLTGANTLRIVDTDQLVVAGKPASNPGSGTLLFSATGFTEANDGTNYWYEVALDLNRTELLAAISGSSTGQLPVLLTIQEENAGNTSRFSFQLPIVVRAPGYAGTESASTAGDLPYPSPDALLTDGLDATLIKRGVVNVATAAAGQAVVFTTPFGSAPTTVLAWLMVPSGGRHHRMRCRSLHHHRRWLHCRLWRRHSPPTHLPACLACSRLII